MTLLECVSGGGCNRSFAVLTVLIMIAVPSVLLSVSDDVHAEVNLEATSGSGTVDDPYSGMLTEENSTHFTWGDIPSEIYVEKGTVISILMDDLPSPNRYTVTEGYGLTLDSDMNALYLNGTANVVGSCVLSCEGMGVTISRAGTEWQMNIHIVETQPSYPILTFESDPITEGILIPPGHHLVTLIAERTGSTINHIVVEDGHVLELTDFPGYDPDGPHGGYGIYNPTTGGYADVSGYVVTNDIVVMVTHNGGNGDGGGSNPGGY